MGNIYAKFEGPEVDGGSTAEGHVKDLELYSWSHGFSLGTMFMGDARTKGTVHHTDVTLSFELNSAFVPMLKSVFTGANFDKVTLFCYRATGEDTTSKQLLYCKIIMEQAICSSVGWSVTGDRGTVSISLNYAKVTYEYNPQTPGSEGEGKQVISHDLKKKQVA